MKRAAPDYMATMKALAPGYYTERDGGNWYIVSPDHDGRIGEDFESRDDARAAMCWVAGGDMPREWSITPNGNGELSYHVRIPNRSRAVLWARDVRRKFPAFAAAHLPIEAP